MPLNALVPGDFFHGDGSGIDLLDHAIVCNPDLRLVRSFHGAILKNDLIRIGGYKQGEWLGPVLDTAVIFLK